MAISVLSVSQLNRYIKAVVDADSRLKTVYIKGEISNFTNHYKSGHFYFSLKDEGALVRAVMFRSYASKVQFVPGNGLKVIVKASVTVYERDGQYQLNVMEMQPDGVGALHLAYEQLKQKLLEQGLFDSVYKKPLPKYPTRIGVITSPTGAAVRDIENILSRRYPLAEMILYPVLVQGEGAPAQLIQALRYFEQTKSVDVIIIGRGGGSIEELWAFNNEALAYQIFQCKIPIVSGVGHETDFTITDFVADLRASTPSAAAELVVPDVQQLALFIAQADRYMTTALSQMIARYDQRLQQVKNSRVLSAPTEMFSTVAGQLEMLNQRMHQTVDYGIEHKQAAFIHLVAKLDTLSPLKVLTRGYTIAKRDRETVTYASKLNIGDQLTLCFQDGEATCEVKDLVMEERDFAHENENDI